MQPHTSKQTVLSLLKPYSLTADTLRIFLFHSLSLSAGIVGSIIIARVLGPTQKGILNLFSLLTTLIAEFGLLGLNSGLLYHLTNRKAPLERVHTAALWGSLLLGGLSCGAILLAFPLLAASFAGLPLHFVVLAGMLAPLLLYRVTWANLMTGINRAPQVYQLNLHISALSLAGMLLLWWVGLLSAENFIWVTVVLLMLQSGYSIGYLIRVHGARFAWDRNCLLGSLRFGGVAYIGVLFNFLHFRIDQVMINHFQGPRGVGIYTVSVSWAELLWLIDYAVINASLYNISSMTRHESWDLTYGLVRRTSLVLFAGALVLAAVSSPLVQWMYGQEFSDAVMPLRLLLPGVVAWGAGRILAQYISYNAGKVSLCTLAAVVGATMNVIGNLFAIPRWGLSGAAMTSSISYLITFALVALTFASLRRQPTIPDAAHISSVSASRRPPPC